MNIIFVAVAKCKYSNPLRVRVPVLGYMPKHLPRHMLRHMLEHVPGHGPSLCLTGMCLGT